MTGFSCEDLFGKNSLRRFLDFYEIRTDRSKGQHFLIDRSALETISGAAGQGKTVLEIGAGVGTLTCLLKKNFSRTFAVEIDEGFRTPFSNVNPEETVRFVNRSFLNLDFAELGLEPDGKSVLAGNIPYNITGQVLDRTVEGRDYFSRAVFTVQREVAQRILAEPGTRVCGSITYYVKAYAEVNHLLDIHAESFYPPPRVDSTAVEIVFKNGKNFVSSDSILLPLIRELFNYRRKTLRKGLSLIRKFSLKKDEINLVLTNADIDPRKRPEELTLEDFDRLAGEIDRRN